MPQHPTRPDRQEKATNIIVTDMIFYSHKQALGQRKFVYIPTEVFFSIKDGAH